MHLPPEIWGPLFWSTMHIVSMAYPDEPMYAEKRAAKDFFNSFIYLLPCAICRTHFQEIFKLMPVESWLDNRSSLTEWVWMIHNEVNKRLKKPEITLSEFYSRYNTMAENGVPIPPSNPHLEITEIAETNAWIRGAASTVAVITFVGIVGGLLWVSYKNK